MLWRLGLYLLSWGKGEGVPEETSEPHVHASRWFLILVGLGIFGGDIETSPLYAYRESVHELVSPHLSVEATHATALQVASLFFWALLLVVSINYCLFNLAADNNGEGGLFAILARLQRQNFLSPWALGGVSILVVLGSAAMLSDGALTPAISVVSAWEGLKEIDALGEVAGYLVIPLSLITLWALFSVQRFGTAKIGLVFGLYMLVWNPVLAAMGLPWIWKHPEVLQAINPMYAVEFAMTHEFWSALKVFGMVDLCITGVEALYADMGHIGRDNVRIAWFFLMWPCLLINYFGQAALLMDGGGAEGLFVTHADGSHGFQNLFFLMVPDGPVRMILVLFATGATIIASQAMISGVFSLWRQGQNLEALPRAQIVHTSADVEGQVYVDGVNQGLMWISILLVLIFRTSSNLAEPYGIAVTGTMAVTSICAMLVHWGSGWKLWVLAPLTAVFVCISAIFFFGNAMDFFQGAWIPLAACAVLTTVMLVRRWGRQHIREVYSAQDLHPVAWLEEKLDKNSVGRNLLFLSSRHTSLDGKIPPPAEYCIEELGIVPAKVALCHVHSVNSPTWEIERQQQLLLTGELPPEERYQTEGDGLVVAINVNYGFVETRDLGADLQTLNLAQVLDGTLNDWIICYGEEQIVVDDDAPYWLRMLIGIFNFQNRLEQKAHEFLFPKAHTDFGLRELPIRVTIYVAADGSWKLIRMGQVRQRSDQPAVKAA